jgi:hypothetical protein
VIVIASKILGICRLESVQLVHHLFGIILVEALVQGLVHGNERAHDYLLSL